MQGPHVKYQKRKPEDFIPRKKRKCQTVAEMKAQLFDPEKLRIVNGGC